MKDDNTIGTQLNRELQRLRRRVAQLEAVESRHRDSQQELRESEKRFRSIYENTLIGLYRTTPDGHILMANPALVRMLGYPSFEELNQRNLEQEGYEPGYPRSVFKETLAADGRVVGLESAWTRHNGRAVYVRESAQAISDENGNVLFYEGTVEDVTERKRAEMALEKRAKELDALYRVGRDLHKSLSTGDLLQRILRYVAMAMQYPETAVPTIELDGEFVSANGHTEQPSHGIHADVSVKGLRRGRLSVYCAEDRSFLIPEEQDLLNGIAEMLSLWLERKEAREALKAHSRSLEQTVQERTKELKVAQEELLRKERLASLGQLAGGVGHELRTPLAVISNAVYYLQTKLAEADGETREYLEIITAEVRDSEKIVSDLLDFSRTRSADRRSVTVSDLVARVLDKLPPAGDVTVVTEVPSVLPEVLVDPGQLAQVLTNIVSNAYQAMPGGGQVTITALAGENGVCLSVSDTGVGIPRADMGRLFEPLFSTKPRGTGLGLAISRMLMQANGGTIDVESEEGIGSTFGLMLPLASGQESEAAKGD